MTEFTKGPWYPGHMCNADHPCNCKSIVAEPYMGSICTINVGDEDPPLAEAIANAHLIAAAPNLYEALNNLVEISKRYELYEIQTEVERGDVALAKARGEA